MYKNNNNNWIKLAFKLFKVNFKAFLTKNYNKFSCKQNDIEAKNV